MFSIVSWILRRSSRFGTRAIVRIQLLSRCHKASSTMATDMYWYVRNDLGVCANAPRGNKFDYYLVWRVWRRVRMTAWAERMAMGAFKSSLKFRCHSKSLDEYEKGSHITDACYLKWESWQSRSDDLMYQN